MLRTGPRKPDASATSYVVVRGSRGLGGGREGGDEAGDRGSAAAGAVPDGLASKLCRRSRQTRSRRNRSRSANSTVVKVASAVVSDDDISTHAAYSPSSRAVAAVSSTSAFCRSLSSSSTRGPLRGSDLGRPTRRLLLSIVFSFDDWFGVNPSAHSAGSSRNLRADLNRETLLTIARDEHPMSQELLHIGRLRHQREPAPSLVDNPDVFAAGRRWVAQKHPPTKRHRIAHECDVELLREPPGEICTLAPQVRSALSCPLL